MTCTDTPRTTRGGPYVVLPRHGRSTYRNFFKPGRAITYLGFRVVCLPREVKPTQAAIRGCSWDGFRRICRSAFRAHYQSAVANYGLIGFRVVCLPQEVAP